MSNSTFEPLAAGMLLDGKYRLTRPIGRGAMGEVWAAINEMTSREVAVKLILGSSPELRHRLLREARSCGALKHPNVIDLYDVAQTKRGEPFLVMELLSGETLAHVLHEKRRLDPPEAVRVALAMAHALAAAHALGIVHRDLKPGNVFLHASPGGGDPVVKVLDFGVAKNLFSDDGLHTTLGGLVGTPAYMSPEQARADRDIDHRADIWSLGVVLFQMLTGVRPFRGETEEILAKIKNGPIPTIGEVMRNASAQLDTIVARCMRRGRDDRFRSAAEVATLLECVALPVAAEDGATIPLARFGRMPSWDTIEPDRASSAGVTASVIAPHPAPAPALTPSRDRLGNTPRGIEPRTSAEVARDSASIQVRVAAGGSSTAPLVSSRRGPPQSGVASRDTSTTVSARSSRERRPVVVIGGIALGVGCVASAIALFVLFQRPASTSGMPATPERAEQGGMQPAAAAGTPAPIPAASDEPAPGGPAPSLSTATSEPAPTIPSASARSSKVAGSSTAGVEGGDAPNSGGRAKTAKPAASAPAEKAPSKKTPASAVPAGSPPEPAPRREVIDPWGSSNPAAGSGKPPSSDDWLIQRPAQPSGPPGQSGPSKGPGGGGLLR